MTLMETMAAWFDDATLYFVGLVEQLPTLCDSSCNLLGGAVNWRVCVINWPVRKRGKKWTTSLMNIFRSQVKINHLTASFFTSLSRMSRLRFKLDWTRKFLQSQSDRSALSSALFGLRVNAVCSQTTRRRVITWQIGPRAGSSSGLRDAQRGIEARNSRFFARNLRYFSALFLFTKNDALYELCK